MKIKLSNIIHWLLLASLLAFLGACSNMSSVRNGKFIIAKSEKKVQIKNAPTDSLLLAMYDNKTTAKTGVENKDDDKPVEDLKETPIKHIPTLQEQMNSLTSRQDNIDNRLNKIESQNNQINNRLDQITDLLKSQPKNDVTATTGLTPDKTKTKKEAFVLYPDDKAPKKKIKSPIKKVAPIKNEEPKTEEPKLFKEAADFVDKKDYNSALLMLLKEEQKQTDPDKLAECRFLIAKSFLSINRYSQAEDYYSKVLSSNISYEKKAEAQASIAKILMKQGNKEEAKKAYETILDKYATTLYVIEAKKMLQIL